MTHIMFSLLCPIASKHWSLFEIGILRKSSNNLLCGDPASRFLGSSLDWGLLLIQMYKK